MGVDTTKDVERTLSGCRIAFVGKLSGLSRREVELIARNQGAEIVSQIDASTDLVVLSDDAPSSPNLAEDAAMLDAAAREACRDGRMEVINESDFWARLGLVDTGGEVQRLYTPAMLATLVGAPIAAIRHWHRRGRLIATRMVGRLPYFDFEEARVAQRLAELLSAGCSLSVVDRKLDELASLQSQMSRPLASADVIVSGRRLYVRRGESITEPNGQLLIDFDATTEANSSGAVIALPFQAQPAASLDGATDAAELRSLALDFEESDHAEHAVEVYRAILMSGNATAEDHFCLAELLYRTGDLAAARERYYAAIELDEDYVEARANLGCVLAELGELPLAEAAFRGALRYHVSFADAHFHLARLLDAMDRSREGRRHWQEFLALAPASPWAEEAHDRVRGSSTSRMAP